MKKQAVSLLVLLLAANSFFFSCNNIMDKSAGALEFDSIQINETAHLFSGTAKPAYDLIISLTYTSKSSDEKMRDSLNTYFLSVCFDEKYMNVTVEEAIKEYTGEYVSDYRKDLEPIYRKDEQDRESAEDIGARHSYYKGIENHVRLYTGHLLVYRIDYNKYTDGAHGVYMSTLLNLDLRTSASTHLDGLFVGDYKEQPTDLLWNQLMANNKVATRQKLEDMGHATAGDLAPTESFYLSEEGITFYYNVYDTTPYIMGPAKITLPYETIQHLLGDGTMVLSEVRNS